MPARVSLPALPSGGGVPGPGAPSNRHTGPETPSPGARPRLVVRVPFGEFWDPGDIVKYAVPQNLHVPVGRARVTVEGFRRRIEPEPWRVLAVNLHTFEAIIRCETPLPNFTKDRRTWHPWELPY